MAVCIAVFRTGKKAPPSKNRVGGSPRSSALRAPKTRSQLPESHRVSRPDATITASGRPVWPNRDPIGERGGLNLHTACKNDVVSRVDPLGLELIVNTNQFTLDELFQAHGVGIGGWTTLKSIFVYGQDVIESQNGRGCCAEVKRAAEIDILVNQELPTTLNAKYEGVDLQWMTEAGLDAVKAHESRRLLVYQLAYDAYFKPAQLTGWLATRCGKVCMPEPGEAEGQLAAYLENMRTAVSSMFEAYRTVQQLKIGAERPTLIRSPANDAQDLVNGYENIHTVAQPPPAENFNLQLPYNGYILKIELPDCPKSSGEF